LSVDGVVVPIRSLSSVWDDCVDGEVHFLKIDVEGAEARVLAGADLARHRPWIIVVESIESVNMEDGGAFELGTRPIPATRHDEWEHHLIDNDYRFVLFDGLNRFYLSEEHPELAAHFSCGPNLFDGFKVQPNHWLCPPPSSLQIASHDSLRAERLYKKTKRYIKRLLRNFGYKDSHSKVLPPSTLALPGGHPCKTRLVSETLQRAFKHVVQGRKE
jgi:hypothetical protein